MYLADYHLHTNNSFDSKQDIKDLCKKAIAMNLKEVAITDHFSVMKGRGSCGFMDKEKYLREINKCNEIFKGKLIVKRGIELCEPHLNDARLHEEIDFMDLDFVLGSVHNVDNMGMNTFRDNYPKDKLYTRYFEEILKLTKSDNINVIAHMDFIKRYAFEACGYCNVKEHEEILREIFKNIVEGGKGIEVNTSGLRNAVNEALPGKSILTLYKECGGEIITCGSDAHKTEDVGHAILESYEILKELGFKYTFTFDKRKAIAHKL